MATVAGPRPGGDHLASATLLPAMRAGEQCLWRQVVDPLAVGWMRPAAWPAPIADPAGSETLIWMNPIPKQKSVKNRTHLDVYGDSEELVELSATAVPWCGAEIDWDVLADPATNSACSSQSESGSRKPNGYW